MTTFKDLAVGDTFDFIEPDSHYNSFYERCEKISNRKYRSERGHEFEVGTVRCKVYHVEKAKACKTS